jgi:hypothetical protein
MSRRRGGSAGRLAVFVVLGALLVGGIALERREPDVASAGVGGGAAAGSIPLDGSVSSAWYCAAGTAVSGGGGDETVYIANLAPRTVEAMVTVYPGGDAPTKTRDVELDAYERIAVHVADLAQSPAPGVIVEVFGGPAVVEHDLRGNGDLAMGPCAHEPSRRWYFAAGDTARGASQILELFNPYGDDAIVDISFVTDGGVQEPQALQGFVVARHSKVSVPIHPLVQRQERVATKIVARTGRIVAEQVRAFDGTEGRRGLTVSLGTTVTRDEWTVPFGDSGTGMTSIVSIANFGDQPAEVEVSVAFPNEGVLAPEVVDVPSRSVVTVDTGARVPAGTGYSVVTRSQGGIPVVVEAFLGQGDAASVRGAATAVGSAEPARQWAIAGAPASASSEVTAVNRSNQPVTVELLARTAGDPDSPPSAPAAVVQPGKMVRFDLDELGIRNDQVLVVSADGPIVAGRHVFVGGVSLATGVPIRD